MPHTSSTFDCLWIIESLGSDDLKTGQSLFDSLQQAKQKHPGFPVYFKQPVSASDLIAVLGEVSELASQGTHPMLHLECHGGPGGLQTTNGDILDWDTIRLPLISINEHCGLNLIVVVAACNGAYLIETANRLDRAPFWAVIGPDQEVTAGAVQRDFTAFYETYFDTLNGDAAVAALNRNASGSARIYHFISVEGLFRRAYREYHRKHCLGKV
jgi:hypothetical protein